LFDIIGGLYYRLPWTLPIWCGERHENSLIQLDDGTLVIFGVGSENSMILGSPNSGKKSDQGLIGFALKQKSNNPFQQWQPIPIVPTDATEAVATVTNTNISSTVISDDKETKKDDNDDEKVESSEEEEAEGEEE
jgi:hypothetical protein